MAEKASETPEPQKPPKSFKLLIMAGGLILLLGAGGVWFFFFSAQSSEESSGSGNVKNLSGGEKKITTSVPGHIYKMEPFVVNLMDPGQLRYLKVTLHVESNQDKVNEEYEKRLPQLRDAILTILTNKDYKEVMSSEGKTALREEIKGKMNQLSVSFKVQNIFFTEFVVQ